MRFKKILPALLCVSLLVSCEATPERKLIEQKDIERLAEQAADSSDGSRKNLEETRKNAQKHYDFSYLSSDKKVRVSADADVFLPETDAVPMYRMSAVPFSQEDAYAIYQALFDGKNTWYYENEGCVGGYSSKELVDRSVEDIKGQIERIKNSSRNSEEKEREIRTLQADIDYIMQGYDSLPDTLEKQPTDGTFRTGTIMTFSGTQEYRFLSAHTDDGDSLSISDYSDFGSADSSVMYSTERSSSYSIAQISQKDYPCQCRYGEEEAQKIADGLIEKIGLSAQMMHTGYFLYSDGTNEESAFCPGYVFYYSRIIDGMPSAVTTSCQIYHDDAAQSWLYERITVMVDDDGIARFEWQNPTGLSEAVSEDVSVIPFTEAAAIFEEMVPLIYQGELIDRMQTSLYDLAYEINVSRVELDLIRVRSSGDITGIYTPAWIFYGTETQLMTDTDRDGKTSTFTEQEPWIILAVNAVDRSIIDITAGY